MGLGEQTKRERDAYFRQQAKKLRDEGMHLCEQCGKTIVRRRTPPFLDCEELCTAAKVFKLAEAIEDDVDRSGN